MIQAFIIDDSAVIREVLSSILAQAPDIQVSGTASDPIFARRKMAKAWPDVIILDINMPRVSGLEFLKEIMAERPTPTIICSSLAEKNSTYALDALSLGAFEVILKPTGSLTDFLKTKAEHFIEVVQAAANSQQVKRSKTSAAGERVTRNDLVYDLIAIGASTGGTRALETILKSAGPQTPPIAIVQHMPPVFTNSFAKRLDEVCHINVKESENNDQLQPGSAYVAPGDFHFTLREIDGTLASRIIQTPPVNRHRPSVDVLFKSIYEFKSKLRVLAIILTGMGADGAAQINQLHKIGAHTIAQNQASCVVFGMPKAAIELGAIDETLSLEEISNLIADVKCA